MIKHRITVALIVLLLAGLSCNLPDSQSEVATNPPPASPYPTVEPLNPTETVPSEPEIQPTALDAQPMDTEEPPSVPEISQGFPIGFAATVGETMAIAFYDLSGNTLGTINITAMLNGPSNYMHIAGPFSGNPQQVPVAFLTSGPQGAVNQYSNGEITTVIPMADVQHLRGVPGQNAYVYATVAWNGEALVSRFYPQTATEGAGTWFWERIDPESWSMVPLAVQGENNELHRLFYTLEPWGIGGDIVYPPRRGLYRLDLDTRENIQILTDDINPIGLSTDNTLVAYTQRNNNIQSGETADIIILNQPNHSTVPIDLAPESNRGGGYAVFSPDNQYAAWMEGSGWSMAETPNFHTRVRIANMSGEIQADVPDIDFAYITGDSTARWVVPKGWVDGQYLLVEVIGDNWNEPSLVVMRFDGSDMTQIGSGQFLSFLYP